MVVDGIGGAIGGAAPAPFLKLSHCFVDFFCHYTATCFTGGRVLQEHITTEIDQVGYTGLTLGNFKNTGNSQGNI